MTPPTMTAEIMVPNTANTMIEPMLAKKLPCKITINSNKRNYDKASIEFIVTN